MEINIEDYLNKDEIKNIVIQELRESISNYFRRKEDIGKIISNIGYEMTFNLINEEVPNFKEQIKESVLKVCSEISSYCVFRKKGEYSSYDTNSVAQDILEQVVLDNKNIIEDKIKSIFNELQKTDLRYEISGILEDYIDNLFKPKEE